MVTYKLDEAYSFCTGPCYRCRKECKSHNYYHIWEHDNLVEERRLGPFDCCLDCARALGLVW